ncbi:hypothetical protein TeGR_g1841 [Tetraparma gracilis]|uniref:tRNA (guanine(9)-N(1))-methyltransferase n=1 Tax=Tetraparma gracilis TaxID=2962635 RepID=A0ABQ6MG44_9STRA|nr:hypothetical protein TeGR_g1841 [Tetraparma gracilis]
MQDPPQSYHPPPGTHYRVAQHRKRSKKLSYVTVTDPSSPTSLELKLDFAKFPGLPRKLSVRNRITSFSTATPPVPPESLYEVSSLSVLDESSFPNATILFDLAYSDQMSTAEAQSLSNQITLSVSSNARSAFPFFVQFSSVPFPVPSTPLFTALSKQAWDKWPATSHLSSEAPWADPPPPFSTPDYIYLTSDSPNTLDSITPSSVLIIGGLVDHTDKPGYSMSRASLFPGLKTARLPIEVAAKLKSRQPGDDRVGVDVTTLSVVQLLLLFRETGDWPEAISRCPAMHSAPLRKYVKWLPPYEHFNDEGGGGARPGAGFSLVAKSFAPAPPPAPPPEDPERAAALAAVTANGDLLMTSCSDYKADREIVLAAVKSSVDALLWVDSNLREDREVLLTACAANGRALRYTSGLRGDKEIALVAVKEDGDALQFCSGLRGDRDVVTAAVTQTGWSLQYASEELRGDVDIVRAAVATDEGSIRCASKAIQEDPSVLI